MKPFGLSLPAMGQQWRKFALAFQAVLLLYFQVCVWIPLGAWNNRRSFPQVTSFSDVLVPAAIGIGTALLILATVLEVRWLMAIGILGHFGWFFSQALTIWPPYIFGASEHYAAMYERVWGNTTKLLPSWGNHLAPDAMHLLIQALLVAVLITATMALLQMNSTVPKRAQKARAT